MKPVLVSNGASHTKLQSVPPPSRVRQWLADRATTSVRIVGRLAREGRYAVLSFVVVLLLASVLLVGVAALQYAAPFVYTVF